MRNHIIFKFLAILLCACSLLVSIASAVGVAVIADQGLYTQTVSDVQDQHLRSDLSYLADTIAVRFAAKNLSNCPETFIDVYTSTYYLRNLLTDGLWDYTLEDTNGQLLEGSDSTPEGQRYEFLVSPEYPVVRSIYDCEDYSGYYTDYAGRVFNVYTDPTMATIPEAQAEEVTEPLLPETDESDFLYSHHYEWGDATGDYIYVLNIYRGPTYLVTLYLRDGAYEYTESMEWKLLELGYQYRFTLLLILCAGLLVFAVTGVYLCCAAGKRPRSQEICPGGLNRLPLDLYAAVAATGIFLLIVAIDELAWWISDVSYLLPAGCGIAVCALAACILFVGFWFAVAAQCKLRGSYWWRHSLIGTVLRFVWRYCKVCIRWLQAALLRLCRQMSRFLRRLPLVWQWLLTGIAMGFFPLLFAYLAAVGRDYWMFVLTVSILCDIAILLYGVYAFGTLMESAKRMSQGDLHSKVNTKWLLGCFRDFGEALNALADVAVVAAKNQIKSERMKAELITNVSHDIKTPLTSIINYVDLLQKANTPEESKAYLEVLDRQSLRLKKLIEDLMDMSKASTGNMAVELSSVDAVEAVNQALGEFSDKLDGISLIPIWNPPAEPVTMRADGRLTWRVLSNLLSNAVKYALPGTRLYVDLVKLDGSVLISLKNISKEQLNVSSEELMERFVRGDTSRNTEGSGLGLNIAKSLMELQQGQLQLLVDGDLFKATLIFPAD